MILKHCHVYERLLTAFGLVIGFSEHLQIVSYKKLQLYHQFAYSAFHYSTYYVSSSCFVFTSRCLVTDLSNVLYVRAHVLSGWRLSHNSSLQLTDTDRTEIAFPLLLLPASGVQHSSVETEWMLYFLLLSRSLRSNKSIFHNNFHCITESV
jgi:hypothetical protein